MPSYPYYTPYGQVTNPYLVYPNTYYTPQVPKAPEQQKNGMLITWVKSEKEVEDEYVGPNCAAAFWDENEPVIYLKKADVTGKPSIIVYDLVERKTEEPKKEEYTTNSDFNTLVGAVNSINETLNKEIKSFNSAVESLKGDVESIKADMYGIAGKKRSVKKTESEEDA